MALKLVINLDQSAADLLTGYGAGAKLYLERDTSAAFAAPSVIASPALVSGTEQYEIWDSSGTIASWYRSRVGNTGGTLYSGYSAAFQGTSVAAYATLDDLTETMNFGATDQSKYNLLADLLVRASDYLNRACGRDFYRHPQVSGTEVRTFHVLHARQRRLTQAIGETIDIVSLSTVEYASATGQSFSTVVSGTDVYLWPANPKQGWPYEDVLVSDLGVTIPYYYRGFGSFRLTGVFGWPAVPELIKQATIDLAREWYRQGPGGGGPIGMSALGQPIYQQGTPPSVRQAVELYKQSSFVYV